nr:hypothetical protein [uncultured Desulfobacter sp.]
MDKLSTTSLFVSAATAIFVYWQSKTTQKMLQASTILKIQDNSIAKNISDKFDNIYCLKAFNSYENFKENTNENIIKDINEVVTHLNYCAQIVEEGLLPKQMIWNRYFWMYRSCGEKLLPWWIEHKQKNHPRKYSCFKRMCDEVLLVGDSEVKKHDNQKKNIYSNKNTIKKFYKNHQKIYKNLCFLVSGIVNKKFPK